MIHFKCSCGNTLFFDNSFCLQCQRPVGYDIATNRFHAIEPGGNLRLCANGAAYGVCNWLVPVSSPSTLCRCCQLTRTIPNLGMPGHVAAWGHMEAEKRRVIYTIARLGLSPLSKAESADGLSFDFLAPVPGQAVVTGHADGVITMNLLEADDGYRENERHALHEPYRTLIGHFRHELGHYFWDRFFRHCSERDARLVEFRALFGDERADYQSALNRHYVEGAPGNWADTFITAYASVHPWEDWAETWAQYLHIVDAVETARAFGWNAEAVPIPFTPFQAPDLGIEASKENASFLHTLNSWMKTSPALNEIAASLGYRNLYPFVLNAATVRKIHFVHTMIAASWCLEAGAKNAA